MARRGRRRRYQEARELKQGFDDGLFVEGDGTLADADRDDADETHDRDAAGGLDVSESDGVHGDSSPS